MKIGVDVANQAYPVRQEQHESDTAGARPWTRSASSYWMLVAVIIGTGRSGPIDFPSRLLIRRRRSWTSRFLRASRFFPESGTHSKASLFWNGENVILSLLFQKHWRFRAFSGKTRLNKTKTHVCGLVAHARALADVAMQYSARVGLLDRVTDLGESPKQLVGLHGSSAGVGFQRRVFQCVAGFLRARNVSV